MQKHNGIIDLESEPGVRTTFYIELPEFSENPNINEAPRKAQTMTDRASS